MHLSLLFAAFIGAVAVGAGATTTPTQECPPPFSPVGGRCLLFELDGPVTWHQGQDRCQGHGAHLAKVDEPNFHMALVDYIAEQGLTGRDYWLGGSDEASEGAWTWVDGSEVKLGTPFWGYWTDPRLQEPNGGHQQDYLCLKEVYFYYFHSCYNEQELYAICQL